MSPWSPSTPSSSLALGTDDGDSRLLSASLPSPDPFDASSRTHLGPGGADLSLSELSLSDRPCGRDGPRFSLLAPPSAPVRPLSSDQSAIAEDDEDIRDGNENTANDTMMERAVAEKAREEKLQRDLFILKKLNASFSLLNNALAATKTATEQVAEQLSQTDALLDKYANMLAKSEGVTRLIFDERWEGAETDEEILAREARERAQLEREREEAARREAEERARQEAEEAARREAEERAQQEAATTAASKSASRGRGAGVGVSSGVRGVRGTRATAMAARGGRGIPRAAPASSSAIPRARSASATGGVGSAIGGMRPSSSASRGTGVPRGVLRKG